MKTHPPKYYLNTLSNNDLETFTGKEIDNAFQEIYESEMKKRKAQIMRRLDAQRMEQFQTITTVIPRVPLCQTFKKPASPVGSPSCGEQPSPPPVKPCRRVICTPTVTRPGLATDYSRYTRSLLQSPKLKDVKLINLSFSQPSTPKWNYSRQSQLPCQTPSLCNRNRTGSSLQTLDIPLTPLLNDPLNGIESRLGGQGLFPLDILQMIDDDTKPVELVDKELHRYTDVTVSDFNVADYLLDIAEDYNVNNFTGCTMAVAQPQQNTAPNTKRKCRRAKPVCFEESLVYKEQKKQRERERRKQRKESFLKESSGPRRSRRQTRRSVKYF